MEQIEKNDEKNNLIYLIIAGICFTFILMLLGYWGAAVIEGVVNENLVVLEAFSKVMENPFDNYFNNYTPILLILTLIFSEFLFYQLLRRQRRKEKGCEVVESATEDTEEQEAELEKPILDTYQLDAEEELRAYTESIQTQAVVEEELDDEVEKQDVFEMFGVVIPKEENDVIQEVTEEEAVQQEDDAKEKIIFENRLIAELKGRFNREQISAMLIVQDFAPDIEVAFLAEMFTPDMSPEDIEDYIKIFYGTE